MLLLDLDLASFVQDRPRNGMPPACSTSLLWRAAGGVETRTSSSTHIFSGSLGACVALNSRCPVSWVSTLTNRRYKPACGSLMFLVGTTSGIDGSGSDGIPGEEIPGRLNRRWAILVSFELSIMIKRGCTHRRSSSSPHRSRQHLPQTRSMRLPPLPRGDRSGRTATQTVLAAAWRAGQ